MQEKNITMRNDLPPHDREAEIAVLGSIFQDNRALEVVKGNIMPEHFYSPGNRRIFATMLKMSAAGEPIDEVTLKDHLGPDGTLQVGGLPYIAEMLELTPTATHAAVYAEIILKKWQARQAVISAQEFIQSISEKGEINGQYDDFKGCMREIVAANLPAQSINARSALIGFSEWLEEKAPALQAKTFTGLDDYLFGIAPRKPTVVAARPGVGKTTLVAQAVIDNAEAGIPTLFFSLEMDPNEIIGRAVSARTNIDGQKLLHRQIDEIFEDEWNRLSVSTGELAEFPFYLVSPERALTVAQIESITSHHIEKYGVGLVVIDHLRKIATDKGNIYEQQTRRICDVAAMAKAMDVPVLVAAQINREGDDKPQLKHLEGSGAIEQESQAVVLLHDANSTSNDARSIDGIIAKNRNGKKGTVTLNLYPYKYTIK